MKSRPGPLTSRAFSSLPSTVIAANAPGGAGGSSLLESLVEQDAALQRLFSGDWPPAKPPEFISTLERARGVTSDYEVDVAICGGTLGILLACSLQLQGHRVAVIEAGPLRGREQDWNTSMEELLQLVDAGVLDASEVEMVAPLAFGPMTCCFGPATADRFELKLQGVLDIAVSPSKLLKCVRQRFEANGGLVLERTPVRGVTVHPDGAAVSLGSPTAEEDAILHARLVVDCMGHRSPIALQQRAGQAPSGVCVQVGSCARGEWAKQWRSSGDFFVTADNAIYAGPKERARVQLFWQAFPSSGGASERSTYMFTYLEPGPEMPGLLEVMEKYWESLPAYQKIQSGGSADILEGVEPRRILFGWFPTYKSNAPLAPQYDRVLSVGDASAVQSPISFGGFCAMLRHLPRYTRGLDLALASDRLGKHDLARLTPYMPNLGTSWMSAAAMTASAPSSPSSLDVHAPDERIDGGASPPPPPYSLVNKLLEGNFKVMDTLPRSEAVTFFRDVTTLATLTAVLVGQTATMAPLLPRVVAELVGPIELAEFGGHLFMLAVYTVLFQLVSSLGLDKLAAKDYDLSCAVDALEYGSGLDSRRQRDPSGSDPNLPRATSGGDTAIEADAGASDTPWWRRPPPTWPPRVDAPTLVFGDVVACYSSGFVALTVMTSGRAAEWPSEGAAIACAWIVGAAVTNAWDPTAVLPSLGLANAVGCVARMAIDAASTRLALALVGAAVAQQRVDVQLLILELALSTSAMVVWRALYTATNPDPR